MRRMHKVLRRKIAGNNQGRGSQRGVKPCPFVIIGQGCGIYHDEDIRNDSVCSTYKCDWLTDPNMPEEFKPSKSQFIVETYPSKDAGTYLRIIQQGGNPNLEVLDWASKQPIGKFIKLDDKDYVQGTTEFTELMHQRIANQNKDKAVEQNVDNQS